MQHVEVCGTVRPLKWSLGVKWLITKQEVHSTLLSANICIHQAVSLMMQMQASLAC